MENFFPTVGTSVLLSDRARNPLYSDGKAVDGAVRRRLRQCRRNVPMVCPGHDMSDTLSVLQSIVGSSGEIVDHESEPDHLVAYIRRLGMVFARRWFARACFGNAGGQFMLVAFPCFRIDLSEQEQS